MGANVCNVEGQQLYGTAATLAAEQTSVLLLYIPPRCPR